MLPSLHDPLFLTPFRSFRRDLDRVFEDFFKDLGTSSWPEMTELAVSPRLDCVEKAEDYEIRADLPGVDPKDLAVTVTGNTLRIEGEKTEEQVEGEQEGKAHVRERRYARYERSISLPEEIDASKVTAKLRHGVLKLVLPKKTQARARNVAITVEGETPPKAGQIEVKGEGKKVA
jgi:HSP20 family protein